MKVRIVGLNPGISDKLGFNKFLWTAFLCLVKGHKTPFAVSDWWSSLNSAFFYCPRCGVSWEMTEITNPDEVQTADVIRKNHQFGWSAIMIVFAMLLAAFGAGVFVIMLLK